jgi:hypothetical protein
MMQQYLWRRPRPPKAKIHALEAFDRTIVIRGAVDRDRLCRNVGGDISDLVAGHSKMAS